MEQTKQTQNETPITDPEVTLTLKASEVFQLNLALITRIGFTQQRWATATSANEQKNSEEQLAYLSNLSGKFQNILKDIDN